MCGEAAQEAASGQAQFSVRDATCAVEPECRNGPAWRRGALQMELNVVGSVNNGS